MTNFKDYMRSKHLEQYVGVEENREDDFDKWIEELRYTELSEGFQSYLNTLDTSEFARVGYELIQGQ